jgi:hypothetical protein
MRLEAVPISLIDPNEDNPRGIDIATQDARLSFLKDSIARFGVLVPVVLTPKGRRFLLVDGERRYHAAKAVGSKELPAFVISNEEGKSLSPDELLFRMFQIHHLRDQWGPVQQCRALEKAYKQTVARADIKSIQDVKAWMKAVADALAQDSGIDERTAMDRVKFLRWPKNIKDALYQDPDPTGYWYICKIEEKIIVPALTNYPEYFEHVEVDEVRSELFGKLKSSLSRSTEVRKIAPYLRVVLTKPAEKRKVHRILDHLRKNQDMTYEEAQAEFEQQFPELLRRDPPTPRRLLGAMAALRTDLDEFDVSLIGKAQRRARASSLELIEAASSLQRSLRDLLTELGGQK